VMPIYREGQKEDLGIYRPVRLTLVPGKVMKQVILSTSKQHIQDNQVIRLSQHSNAAGLGKSGWKAAWQKGPRDVGRQPAEFDPAVRLDGQEGQ